ncbi:MAG: ATP-binding protein [Spirochaetes bacterium]|nr:ATP-binding protein [Spirochaetota bacterium]
MYFNFFLLGIFCALLITHFFIFLGRKKDKTNLAFVGFIFSIICLLGFYKIITQFYAIDENITGMTVPSLVPFFSTMFLYQVFQLKRLKMFFIILLSLFLTVNIVLLILYLMDPKTIWRIFYYAFAMIVLYSFAIGIIYQIVKQKAYQQRKQFIIFTGFIATILSFTFMVIFYLLDTHKLAPISYLGIIIMMMTFVYAIIEDFNREHQEFQELHWSLEKKVKQRTDELEQEKLRKTNFFVNLANETKTPLTLIEGYLDFYRKSKKKEDFKVLEKNIQRLKKMVLHYLNIEQMEKGLISYNHEQIFSITNVFQDLIPIMERKAEQKQITIYSQIEDNLFIICDSIPFESILFHLIDNAIKFTDYSGTIEIEVKSLNIEKFYITIRDNGIGIAEDEIENIFKPYYMIVNENSQKSSGMGLGLFQAKKVVESLNGQIKVESQLGQGSTFTIILDKNHYHKDKAQNTKLSIGDLIMQSQEIDLPVEYNVDYKNVFYVDDNEDLLHFFQLAFNDEYNIYYACNGKEALKKLDDIPKPNIIISDIMMDEMDGLDFYKEIQNDNRFNDVPFIFLTARNEDAFRIEALREGAIDYITKPFQLEELKVKIHNMLKNRDTYTKKISHKIINAINKINDDEHKETFSERIKKYNLTNREEEVASLLKKGFLYKEIAFELNVSIKTVEGHIQKIYEKMKVNSKSEFLNKIHDE